MDNFVFPFNSVANLNTIFNDEPIPYDIYNELHFDFLKELDFCNFSQNSPIRNVDESLANLSDFSLPNSSYHDTYSINRLAERLKFSVFFTNIRSIPSNFEHFQFEYVQPLNCLPTVIGMCETRLDPNIEQLYHLPGYRSFFNSISTTTGGVAIFLNESFSDKNVQILENMKFSLDYIESLFVKVWTNHEWHIFGVIYRRPNTNFQLFIEKYSQILSNIGKTKCILTGDYNLDLLKFSTSQNVRELVDLSLQFDFKPFINKPTRVSGSSATIIDHIWCNYENKNFISGILQTDTADHFTPFLLNKSHSISSNATSNNSFSYIDYAKVESDEFKIYVSEKFSSEFDQECENPDDILKSITSLLKDSIDKFCKKKFVYKTTSRNKPWCTQEIKDLSKIKQNIYKKYVKKPLIYANEYKSVRNRLNNLIDLSKKRFFQEKFQLVSGDVKKTWSVISEVLNRPKTQIDLPKILLDGRSITDGAEVVQSFNDFFSNIGEDLASTMPVSQNSFRSYLSGDYPSSFFIRSMLPSDVERIIRKSKNTSGGFDEIPSRILKSVSSIISGPISILVNFCISKGYFPTNLKLAKVLPIHKSGSRENMNNFRPISLLPSISKIFEFYLYEQLLSYFDRFNIITTEQCGFRKNTSTNVCIANFLKKVIECLDERGYCVGIFMDLRKAFDLVNHDILLNKMEHYGIRGNALSLFTSYLTGRTQYVEMKGFSSAKRSVSLGVPQGSVLGPLFFLLYINDIVNSTNLFSFNLFADDTTLFCENSNLDNLFSVCNRELDKVNAWIIANKLSLNTDKTVFMLFSGKKRVGTIPNLFFSGRQISHVEETKFLGVIIDRNLSWFPQVKAVCSRVSRNIGVMYKIKNLLTEKTLKMLYYSFIYPYLYYGIIFWGGTAKIHFNRVFKLQKRAVRVVTGRGYLDHTTPLFISHSLLKLSDIYSLEIGKFMYNDQYNRNIFNLTPRSNVHNYNTRNRNQLNIPEIRTARAGNFLKSMGVRIWNELSDEIKDSTTMAVFKIRFKNKILDQYSNLN